MSLSWGLSLAGGLSALRPPLLLLGLWTLLSPAQGSRGYPLWHFVSTEVVIPRKETHHGKGLRMPGRLSYSLHFGGQRHVIHLHRKNVFWSRHLLLMTQDDQGALQMDYPYIPTDCYYLGHLEEIPQSMVTVHTCYGGLEGMMKLDDLAYEIKPLKDSQRFEHVVSQILVDVEATGPTHRLGHEEPLDPLFPEANFTVAPRLSSKNYASHTGAIKGQLQCVKAMYENYNNISRCAKFLIDMYSIVDSFMQGIDVRFYIYVITIYNEANPASVTDYRVPGSPMHSYYVNTIRSMIQPHSSNVILKNGPFEHEYDPPRLGVCQDTGLIFISMNDRHQFQASVIAANRIGRSLGLHYDNNTGCVCQRRSYCIMRKFPGITDAFSNCSFVHMQDIFSFPNLVSCIFQQRWDYLNRSLVVTRCGNSVVEDREQCDCGSFKQCYGNPCCTNNCRFTVGSICDKGTCCTNCTFTPSGTLCRTIQNICDLPEYCGGASIACPDDLYLQDGTPCTEEGYCYHGNCTDRSLHCKEIFGLNAEDGGDTCYTINTNKFRFGHCGRNEESNLYRSCLETDKKCGRLQCTNVTHLPRLQEHVSFHQSIISGTTCFGLDEHRSTGTTDVGHVRNGTPCALGKFCLSTACKGVLKSLNYDCVPQKCSHRGICNNRKHCHCHVGWDPPLCLKPGAGGSVDSGPPPRRVRSVKQSLDPVLYLRVIFARIYACIAAMLLGVAFNTKVIKTVKVEETTAPEGQKEMPPEGQKEKGQPPRP